MGCGIGLVSGWDGDIPWVFFCFVFLLLVILLLRGGGVRYTAGIPTIVTAILFIFYSPC
ncbi:hypothetical protein QBC40DRAFT_277599 [Triangularia verruculosa]|uniref:Uncharacterized protein n=1 Tax=Triangularia verruculosa TaxID=2587418 RepID=A0AAN6XJK3_9PEZI|nr:hypothetical protein QBC40DRAFT_277599 [Triangularia verruculosa]